MYDISNFWDIVTKEVDWSAIGNLAVGGGTLLLAYFAKEGLHSWKKQELTKIQSSFLDEFMKVFHEYSEAIINPIQYIRIIKIGIESHTHAEKLLNPKATDIDGVAKFLKQNGDEYYKKLSDSLSASVPHLAKLRSLTVKGSTLNFNNYSAASTAYEQVQSLHIIVKSYLTFMTFKAVNYDNPDVQRTIKKLLAVNPSELDESLQTANDTIHVFISNTLKQLWNSKKRQAN